MWEREWLCVCICVCEIEILCVSMYQCACMRKGEEKRESVCACEGRKCVYESHLHSHMCWRQQLEKGKENNIKKYLSKTRVKTYYLLNSLNRYSTQFEIRNTYVTYSVT